MNFRSYFFALIFRYFCNSSFFFSLSYIVYGTFLCVFWFVFYTLDVSSLSFLLLHLCIWIWCSVQVKQITCNCWSCFCLNLMCSLLVCFYVLGMLGSRTVEFCDPRTYHFQIKQFWVNLSVSLFPLIMPIKNPKIYFTWC